MFNAFFNTSVRHLAETLTPGLSLTGPGLTDSLLAPLHFLFKGRSVVLFQNNVVREDRLSDTWVTVAIITLVITLPILSGSK